MRCACVGVCNGWCVHVWVCTCVEVCIGGVHVGRCACEEVCMCGGMLVGRWHVRCHIDFSALLGFCYTLIILGISRYNIHETVIRAFDVITIVVPPALPAALTVGTVYALQRLKKQQIYCISPQRWVWSSVLSGGCGHQRWVGSLVLRGGCGPQALEVGVVISPQWWVWSSVVGVVRRPQRWVWLYTMPTCNKDRMQFIMELGYMYNNSFGEDQSRWISG